MASKAKRKRQKEARKSSRLRKPFWALLAVILLVVAIQIGWSYQLSLARDKAEFASALFRDQLANLINNGGLHGRLPHEIRAKLSDIAQRNLKQDLEFQIFALEHPSGHKVLMSADPHGAKPVLNVHAPYYLQLRQSEDPEMFDTLVALSIMHETVHLERWPLANEPTAEEFLAEEIRAYGRTSLEAVRPMRNLGLPIEQDFIRLDDILIRCADNPQCPQFVQAIKSYLE